jgi:hypothetical protein
MLLRAAVALLLASPPAVAADHRDAPTIDDFSAIDINDVYMFRDPPCMTENCTSPNLVMVLSTQAIADPSFGLTYHFQPNALYRLNFSTTDDDIKNGIATAQIDFVFSPFENGPSCPTGPACQTFRAVFPNGVVVNGLTTQGSANATQNPPVFTNVGPIRIFAGPREDPFFFDLVGFNRFIAKFNQTNVADFSQFTGQDAFKGKNINAIVVEFPISMLLRPGQTKLAAWASTYLGEPGSGELSQLDRMGNPGVNTVLIDGPHKDAFNFGLPQNDARDFAPIIAGNLIRYGVDQTNILPVLATAAIPDTLKFDTTKPDGYLNVPPNGRQLTDRTTDFLLSLFFNVTTPTHALPSCPVAVTPFSDCTQAKVPLTEFPFVGAPQSAGAASPLVAAVLPTSRSAVVGSPVTAFATIINSGGSTATACGITPNGGLPINFVYQTTNPTNALTGSPNTPVDIVPGAAQNFVIAATPTAAFAPVQARFDFACSNAAAAAVYAGVNTLLLSASTNPVPDIVALAATMSNDGILHIPGNAAANAFAVATVNVGESTTITAIANTGAVTLPISLTLCATNQLGNCIATPSPSVTASSSANGAPTFGVFARATGAIPFDPANNRIFVQFLDPSGTVRGSTSVAVATQ